MPEAARVDGDELGCDACAWDDVAARLKTSNGEYHGKHELHNAKARSSACPSLLRA